jgi:hypothetical protein
MGCAAYRASTGKSAGARRAIPCAFAALFLSSLPTANASSTQPNADTVVQHSIEALKSDWRVEPKYNYRELDVTSHGSRSYQVLMILGSPYRRIEAINGTPLGPESRQAEQRKLKAAIARRCGESKAQTQKRIADYNKGRERDHLLMKEMTNAFVFSVLGETTTNGRAAWHLRATPKPGYQPLDKETRVLTGMKGDLWIDKDTFQWIQVVAQVIHPVSIEGFLARVEPGTRFKLVQAPVTGGVWFPSEFSFGSKVRVLSFIGHNGTEDDTFSAYQAADYAKLAACPAGARGDNAGNQ